MTDQEQRSKPRKRPFSSSTAAFAAGRDTVGSSGFLRCERGRGLVDAPLRIDCCGTRRAELPARLSGSIFVLFEADRGGFRAAGQVSNSARFIASK